jgi:DNA replication protein DnaC
VTRETSSSGNEQTFEPFDRAGGGGPVALGAVVTRFEEKARKWRQRWEALSEEERVEILASEEMARVRELETQRQRRVAERLQTIPIRHRGLEIELPDLAQWTGAFLEAEGRDMPSVLLVGPTGVGKTGNACAALQAVIEAHYPAEVLFVKFRTLLRQLRPGGDLSAVDFNRICSCGLLCLDDVGAEKGSEWAEEQLLEIVDTRYDNLRSTLMTANALPATLAEEVGNRAASRLGETSRVIAMQGPDRRLKR